MNMKEQNLSDLSAGDEVYCGLDIYTIRRVTPTGRIVTTTKNSMGIVYEETWDKNGNIMGADDWNLRSIAPLTDKDQARIMAKRKRNKMLAKIENESWRHLGDHEIGQVYLLLKSFEKNDAA